jgi:hypothetical protein
LHGYPEWWNDLQACKRRDVTGSDGGLGQAAVAMEETRAAVTGELGQAAVAMTEARLSLSTPVETSLTDSGICNRDEFCDPRDDRPAMCSPPSDDKSEPCSSSRDDDSKAWVIDSGASDHMTFDPADFTEKSQPQRTCIANANGVLSPVTGAGTVNLSPNLSLTHTLLVPSLSHKLLSVSQVTTALNCVVLMYSTFCLLQDILTKEIIGRGTKRGGLYYMKHLFLNLFSSISIIDFKCETCIMAKSHKASYPLSLNKSMVPFDLIHSDVWGPAPVSTASGIRWFVIFIDDCTRMT